MHNGHEHSHNPNHGHENELSHSHEHIQETPGSAVDQFRKITALLAYMHEHNRKHVEELRALAQELAQAGTQENYAEATRLVLEGTADFDRGNEKLAAALSCLKE